MKQVRLLFALLCVCALPASAAIYNVSLSPYNASTSSSDNTAAIQAAIDAATSAGGGEVYFPDFYKCKSTLSITNASQVHLHADGDRSGIWFKPDSNIDDGILISGSAYIQISGMRLEGTDNAPSVARLIRISGGYNTSIRNNNFARANFEPAAGPTAAIAVYGNPTTDLHIEGNDFNLIGVPNTDSSLGKGYDITNWGNDTSRVFINGNHFAGNFTEISIALFDTSEFTITNNYINQNNKITAPGVNGKTSGGYAIMLYARNTTIGRGVIANNYIRNTAGSGIYLAGTAAVNNTTDRDIGVHGNTLLDVAKQEITTSLPVGAIALNTVHKVLLTNNRIELSGQHGIDIVGSTTVTVAENNVLQAAGYGIHVYTGSTGIDSLPSKEISITGNRLPNNASGGYSIATTTENPYVWGNRVATGPIQGQATLSGGTVNVSTAEAQAGEALLVTRMSAGGTLGQLTAFVPNNGTITISSSSSSDTSSVFWQLVH